MEHLEKNIFMDNTQLELKSVYKNFGSVTALKNISMTTESGQINCILGDNGAGKSTLVNIISGVFKPSKGEYKICLLYTSPSPRDATLSRMPSSA